MGIGNCIQRRSHARAPKAWYPIRSKGLYRIEGRENEQLVGENVADRWQAIVTAGTLWMQFASRQYGLDVDALQQLQVQVKVCD